MCKGSIRKLEPIGSTTLNGEDVFLSENGHYSDLYFEFSPLPDTSGYQQSEPANVADVGFKGEVSVKNLRLPLNAVLPTDSRLTDQELLFYNRLRNRTILEDFHCHFLPSTAA
jgi:hypothetical protein